MTSRSSTCTADGSSPVELAVVSDRKPDPGGRALSGPGFTPALTEFENKVVAFFVETAAVLGIPRSVAMIYGVLFGSASPLTFAEIERKLRISKGSVSQGLRFLRSIGAVEPALAPNENHRDSPEETSPKDQASEATAASREPVLRGRATSGRELGSRTAQYSPVIDIRSVLMRLLKEKLKPQLATGSDRIDRLRISLLSSPISERDTLELRLKHLRQWQRRAGLLLPLLSTLIEN